MTRHPYDNEVHEDNVYGHTLELLRRHVGSGRDGEAAVHLDVACGFGHIAEHVRDDLGLEYVGVDLAEDLLETVGSRGFETHRVDLLSPDVRDRLREVVGARRIASISFLDGLEHLVDGTGVLSALAGLAAEHDALVVTSVPNVTHLDVAVKALLGTWEYTPSGLLDRTHVQLWSAAGAEEALGEAGLRVVDRYDVRLEQSDQHVPADHVALSFATSLGAWLATLRDGVEPHGLTNQFVWASRTSTADATTAADDPSSDAPFLSFLVHTTGADTAALDETLLSIAAQSDTDVEVVVLAEAAGDALDAVRSALAEHPPTLHDRTVLVPASGSLAEVLNAGLAAARGTYVALSDDITWMGHWVELAHRASRDFPGRCVRGLVMDQPTTTVHVGGAPGTRAEAAPQRAGSTTFSLVENVARPLASPYGVAFPRSLVTDLGVELDDAFGTAAVRRHLLRAVELAGVTDLAEIVALRRQSVGTTDTETDEDLARLVADVDSTPWLVPVGSATAMATAAAAGAAAVEADLGPVAESLQQASQTIAVQTEQIGLKDDHIANLERMLADRDTRLERLQQKLAKRTEQVERLRSRVRTEPAADDDAGDDSSGRGPRWFKRGS